ncbi:MAG: ABC transporter permease [Bacteroidetes bacterium]|nr:ABC transporter permease [Bacteroidota bacterium]
MSRYILKRMLFFIPTLILISLLAFIISINAPGDPVDRMVSISQSGGDLQLEPQNLQEQKMVVRKQLGLDLPVFYINVSNIATPDTLYKIADANERNALKRLIAQNGNWQLISDYNSALHNLYTSFQNIQLDSVSVAPVSHADAVSETNNGIVAVKALLISYDTEIIESRISTLEKIYTDNPFLNSDIALVNDVRNKYVALQENKSLWKNYIPQLHWHSNNQYHRWIFGDGNWLTGKNALNSKGIIRGDMGISYTTKLPVSNIIRSRIGWSLFFTFTSVLLAYLISIPIGLKAAAKKNGLFDRSSTVILFVLYSMPVFWTATLLLMTFANPDILKIFPASGVQPVEGIPKDASFFEMIRIHIPYLILPTICYTYAQLAFLSRITRVSALEIISMDYIRTAQAKGLSENKVLYKHVFRNALLPIITVFSNIFPAAIGGSVILETIFTIPGMGREIIQAIYNQDYPVIVSVFTITGVLTLLGYLIADILYSIADPRITYNK